MTSSIQLPKPKNHKLMESFPYRVFYGEDFSALDKNYEDAWSKFDEAWNFLYNNYERGVEWESLSFDSRFYRRIEFVFRDINLALMFKLKYCNP